jgi:hypothetical protein
MTSVDLADNRTWNYVFGSFIFVILMSVVIVFKLNQLYPEQVAPKTPPDKIIVLDGIEYKLVPNQ